MATSSRLGLHWEILEKFQRHCNINNLWIGRTEYDTASFLFFLGKMPRSLWSLSCFPFEIVIFQHFCIKNTSNHWPNGPKLSVQCTFVFCRELKLGNDFYEFRKNRGDPSFPNHVFWDNRKDWVHRKIFEKIIENDY